MVESIKAIQELLRFERNWMLCLICDDQFAQLGRLMSDLRCAPSSSGDGKKIDFGFSYWGVGPTRSWERACTDMAYLVMKDSIATFKMRWDRVNHKLADARRHYVSLGVGTGQKDHHILADIGAVFTEQNFFAVDMSAEMLRYSMSNTMGSLRKGQFLAYAIQLDFADRNNLDELKSLVHRCVGTDPVLYSLLGNTIANFVDDTKVLKNIVRLLRPQDQLLLELAYTHKADDETSNRAAEEYRRSDLFKQFATSALLHNTDLPIELDRVQIIPQSDAQGNAIVLKVIYHGKKGGEEFTLPDRLKVKFPASDTIRIYYTRKYTKDGVRRLFEEAGCHAYSEYCHSSGRFGMALYMLGSKSGAVFVSFSSKDLPFVKRLKTALVARRIDPWTDFDDSDMDAKLYDGIKAAVKNADKVLLVFSDNSKNREWVKTEVRLAFKELNRLARIKIHVILLTPIEELQTWQCLDDENGDNLAHKLLAYPASNFSDWENLSEASFDERVEHLAKALLDH